MTGERDSGWRTGEEGDALVRDLLGPPGERSHVEARTLATGKAAWTVKVVVGADEQGVFAAVDLAKAALARAREETPATPGAPGSGLAGIR